MATNSEELNVFLKPIWDISLYLRIGVCFFGLLFRQVRWGGLTPFKGHLTNFKRRLTHS
jgi:hypothetical protein